MKEQKRVLLAGTARFNKKPKTGLAFLEEKGLISTSDQSVSRSRSVAVFLKKSPRLDKKLLGEYISRSENGEILKEFIGLYDFRGVRSSIPFLAGSWTLKCAMRNVEIGRGCPARVVGELPFTWRGTADRSDHVDVCGVLFRHSSRCVRPLQFIRRDIEFL